VKPGPFTFPLVEPEPWTQFAACRNMPANLFFPEQGQSTTEAKAVCAECAVRERCLTYALDHHERYGIWGGLSARERTRIRRAQEREAS